MRTVYAFTAVGSFAVLPGVSVLYGTSVSPHWIFVDLLYLLGIFCTPDLYMNPL